MKMLSNRTGGIPAFIFAVLLVMIGFSVGNVNAQDYNNYNNGYNNYDDGYSNNNYGDYQEFYDDLSPYGQWFNDPQYGYVWTPNAGRDFRPYYTNGRWVMTDYGNMWVSDYSWGWAPFHYGRWAQSAYYGWIWIPGRTWGPAWVNWRQGGGYYGWSPMGPGISINFSFGSGYNVPTAWWTFIPCGNIYSRSYARYYSPRQTVNIINNTTIINNTYVDHGTRNTYITGPRRSDVETATRQRVTVYNVSNRSRAGAVDVSGRSVNVYRPSIREINTRNQSVPAPRQVKTMERSVVTNTGGGRAPSRSPLERVSSNDRQVQPDNNSRSNQLLQQRGQRDQQQRAVQQQNAVREAQGQQQRSVQQQQERVQRESSDQQRMLREQQAQQVQQQQRLQRDQQMQQQQRVQQQQQQAIQQQQRQQRDQQMQQQRVQQQQQQAIQQQQRMQRDQQMQQQQRVQQQQQQAIQQQQRMQQQQQRDQQMQQQRMQQQQMQQQRNVERVQPQRVERSNSAPQQRAAEPSPRGR